MFLFVVDFCLVGWFLDCLFRLFVVVFVVVVVLLLFLLGGGEGAGGGGGWPVIKALSSYVDYLIQIKFHVGS